MDKTTGKGHRSTDRQYSRLSGGRVGKDGCAHRKDKEARRRTAHSRGENARRDIYECCGRRDEGEDRKGAQRGGTAGL